MDLKIKKLKAVYKFLKRNRKYNKRLHLNDYKSILLPYDIVNKKAYALLYKMLNTQSQLKLDKSHQFFFNLSSKRKSLNSFSSFVRFLNDGEQITLTYSSLQKLLSSQPGWGNKTAGLFVKAIYNTHYGFARELAFLA